MKKTLVLCTLASMLIFSCTKPTTNENTSLPAKAETKPQYDNTSFGVYKGVIVGSTGSIVFRINNGDNVVKGYLSIDNKKDTLSTTQTLVAGQPIVNVKFTGRISSMTLNADADGRNSEISNIKIDGHTKVAGVIFHEQSTKQVFCYEGKLTGNLSGTINFTRIAADSKDSAYVSAIAKFSNNDTLFVSRGGFANNITTCISYSGATPFIFTGKMESGNLNGTWFDFTQKNKGSFSCVRTY